MKLRKMIFSLLIVLMAAGLVQASEDDYVADMNIFASKMFGEFKADVTAHYGLSDSRFDLMLKKVDSPGDLAVALWLGKSSQQPVEEVVKQYRIHRGKGWGVIARELGIKPGSPAFKQLKNGDLGWVPKEFDTVMHKHKKDEAVARKEKARKEKGNK